MGRVNIGTEEDSILQLDRAAQVTIFTLRTGHCQLLSHLHRLKKKYPIQTNVHVAQVLKPPTTSCRPAPPLRRQAWPSPVDAYRKLRGPVEILRQTANLALLTGLKI